MVLDNFLCQYEFSFPVYCKCGLRKFFFFYVNQLYLPYHFFSDLWEQKPLLIKRHQTEFNEGWFSTKELDDILRQVTTRLIIMPYNNFKKVKYMVSKMTFSKLLLT